MHRNSRRMGLLSPSMMGGQSKRLARPAKTFDADLNTPQRMALAEVNKAKLEKTAEMLSPDPPRRATSPFDSLPMLTRREVVRELRSEHVDPTTELSSWFVAGAPRDEVKQLARELAIKGRIGQFLVRDKLSSPNNYALVVKERHLTLRTFLLKKGRKGRKVGFAIEGAPREELFGSLSDLISYYAEGRAPTLGVRLVCTDEDREALDLILPDSWSSGAEQDPVNTPKVKFVRSHLKKTAAQTQERSLSLSPNDSVTSPEHQSPSVPSEVENEKQDSQIDFIKFDSPFSRPQSTMSSRSILKVHSSRPNSRSESGRKSVSFHESVNTKSPEHKPVKIKLTNVDLWGLSADADPSRGKSPMDFETVDPMKAKLHGLAKKKYNRQRALTPLGVSPGHAQRVAQVYEKTSEIKPSRFWKSKKTNAHMR